MKNEKRRIFSRRNGSRKVTERLTTTMVWIFASLSVLELSYNVLLFLRRRGSGCCYRVTLPDSSEKWMLDAAGLRKGFLPPGMKRGSSESDRIF